MATLEQQIAQRLREAGEESKREWESIGLYRSKQLTVQSKQTKDSKRREPPTSESDREILEQKEKEFLERVRVLGRPVVPRRIRP
jgi:hypothetical protein